MRRFLFAVCAVLFASASMLPATAQEPVVAHVHTLDTLPIPSFAPAEVTIRVGDAVEWDNHASRVHTVTHGRCPRIDARNDPASCAFDTQRDRGADLGTGDRFLVSFASPGVFPYVCAIHRFGGTITVVGENTALPNLVVDAVEFFATPLRTSQRVQATIANEGTGTSPGSRVVFEYRPRGETSWTRFGDVPVEVLAPNEQVLVNQDWFTSNKIGDYEVRVVADGASTVAETDETDNARTVSRAFLLPEGAAPGAPLPDPPAPQPVTTHLPTPPKP